MKKVKFKKYFILIITITYFIGFILLIKQEINRNRYDINKDGKIDIKDLLELQKYIIKESEQKNER